MKIIGTGLMREAQMPARRETQSVPNGFEQALEEQVAYSMGNISHSAPAMEGTRNPLGVVSTQAATVLNQHEISFFENMLNPKASRYGRENAYGAQTSPVARFNGIA